MQSENGEVFDEARSDTHSSKHSVASHHLHKPKTSNVCFMPKYTGAANAFAIQLFCIEERYESR